MASTHAAFAPLGGVVLAFVFLDVTWTTLHRGGGPLTRLFVGPLWQLAQRPHHRGWLSHRIMSVSGVALVLGTVLAWIVLLWLGWTLVFLASPDAVIAADTRRAASVWERVYFVGFTVFTLGVGDYTPKPESVWQLLTALASFTGFGLVTFVITYLMPVVESAASKRALAGRLTALGSSPEAMVGTPEATGARDAPLDAAVAASLPELAVLQQQHAAYPVLHFFHHTRPEESVAVAIARVDEALRLDAARRNADSVPRLHRQWGVLVDRFLDTMGTDADDVEAPPGPDLQRAYPQASVDDARSYASQRVADRRRRRLTALVQGQGWQWDDVRGVASRNRG